ncbi:MAG: 5-(carboxyamino)imidazole ribonucleotide mutase [Phycisphaeraceae bacterium]|nr:5-(carboxyamino)imidazole ribonucleotide mutase [Phycisphaeraceae bacterium]
MSQQSSSSPQVGIVMGSASDAQVMNQCAATLKELGIGCEMKVCSAHRTPQRAHDYATTAAARGLKVIIAAAGMSAHLAGVMASLTHLPVLGVPMEGKLAGGLDALLSTCNMPKGIPVGTMSLGVHGAVNAALFAAAILATSDKALEQRLLAYREKQTAAIPEEPPQG